MPWEIVPPGTKIDFIGKRRLAALLSGLLLLTSLAAVWVNGVRLGIDFAGGTEVQLEFAQGVPASDGAIRDVLTEALEIAEPSVIRYGEPEDNEFLIKFKGDINSVSEVGGQEGVDLITKLGLALEGAIGSVAIERVEFVGPRVGAELRVDGLKSLFYASLAILIYIAFRFSPRFAPGAIVAVLHDLS
ncbi:MAG: protein translocase subunit SecF, partial [Myxococcota bacterium]